MGGERRTENWQIHDPDESIVCLESHLKSIRLIDFEGGGGEKRDRATKVFSEECSDIGKTDDFLGQICFLGRAS
ncbi:hypothetical protein P3S68_020547 [Capsicum galapagoense]